MEKSKNKLLIRLARVFNEILKSCKNKSNNKRQIKDKNKNKKKKKRLKQVSFHANKRLKSNWFIHLTLGTLKAHAVLAVKKEHAACCEFLKYFTYSYNIGEKTELKKRRKTTERNKFCCRKASYLSKFSFICNPVNIFCFHI